ncbi:hypothetical protein D3C81_1943360 [compost metagenome]
MEDVLAHFLEQGAGALQVGRAAAHHEGEGAGNGAAGAAGNGCVDEADAAGLSCLGYFLAGGGSDGGAVDDERALGDVLQQAGLAGTVCGATQKEPFHMLAGG